MCDVGVIIEEKLTYHAHVDAALKRPKGLLGLLTISFQTGKMAALCMTSSLWQSYGHATQIFARFWSTAVLYGVEMPALIRKEPKMFNIGL